MPALSADGKVDPLPSSAAGHAAPAPRLFLV